MPNRIGYYPYFVDYPIPVIINDEPTYYDLFVLRIIVTTEWYKNPFLKCCIHVSIDFIYDSVRYNSEFMMVT